MKTILLLRHAKSDWGDPGLADFNRPLAKRGLKDAPRMGKVLRAFNFVPDQIISSPAQRAKQTSQLAAEVCGYKQGIEWDASFYGGGSEDMISAIKRLPNSVERVMLVGHNPTMEETAGDLLLDSGTSWEHGIAIRMPTAALICFDLHIMDWSVLSPGDAVLRWFIVPRLIKTIE